MRDIDHSVAARTGIGLRSINFLGAGVNLIAEPLDEGEAGVNAASEHNRLSP